MADVAQSHPDTPHIMVSHTHTHSQLVLPTQSDISQAPHVWPGLGSPPGHTDTAADPSSPDIVTPQPVAPTPRHSPRAAALTCPASSGLDPGQVPAHRRGLPSPRHALVTPAHLPGSWHCGGAGRREGAVSAASPGPREHPCQAALAPLALLGGPAQSRQVSPGP